MHQLPVEALAQRVLGEAGAALVDRVAVEIDEVEPPGEGQQPLGVAPGPRRELERHPEVERLDGRPDQPLPLALHARLGPLEVLHPQVRRAATLEVALRGLLGRVEVTRPLRFSRKHARLSGRVMAP